MAHLLSENGYMPRWLLYFFELELLELERFNIRATLRRPEGYEFFRASPQDVDALADVINGGDPVRKEFSGYLADGHHCFGVAKDGRPVGYLWVFLERYPLAIDNDPKRTLTFTLGPDVVFYGVGYIAPEFRLRGLFAPLYAFAVSHYGEHVRHLTAVSTLNLHSIRSHHRLGFRPIGTAVCRRVLGSPYHWSVHGAGGRRSLGFGQREIPLSMVAPVPL